MVRRFHDTRFHELIHELVHEYERATRPGAVTHATTFAIASRSKHRASRPRRHEPSGYVSEGAASVPMSENRTMNASLVDCDSDAPASPPLSMEPDLIVTSAPLDIAIGSGELSPQDIDNLMWGHFGQNGDLPNGHTGLLSGGLVSHDKHIHHHHHHNHANENSNCNTLQVNGSCNGSSAMQTKLSNGSAASGGTNLSAQPQGSLKSGRQSDLSSKSQSEVSSSVVSKEEDESTMPRTRRATADILTKWKRLIKCTLLGRPEFAKRSCWVADAPTRSIVKSATCDLASQGLLELFSPSANHIFVPETDPVEAAARERKYKKAANTTTPLSRRSVFGNRPQRFSSKKRRPWYREPPIVDPDSPFMLIWSLAAFAFLFMDVFLLSLSVFGVERDGTFDWFDITYWTLDIFLGFCTGFYTKNGESVFKQPEVMRHYLRTWFGFDMFLIGSQWAWMVIEAAYIEGSSSGLQFMRFLRWTKYIKVLRLLKLNRAVHQVQVHFQTETSQLGMKMVSCLAIIVLWVHYSATIWYLIGKRTDTGWISEDEALLTWPTNWLVSLHWAASQLQGSIDVHPTFEVWERAYAVSQLLLSVVALALVVSRLTTVMQALQQWREEKSRLVRVAQRFVENHNLPIHLSQRMNRYLVRWQITKQAHQQLTEEQELLQQLPINMQRELLEQARSPLLNQHLIFPALARCSSRFMQRLLCDLLHGAGFFPGELVFQDGVVATDMYIVVGGETSYLHYTKNVRALMRRNGDRSAQLGSGGSSADLDTDVLVERHKTLRSFPLERGSALGEPVLWTRWVHNGDFSAVSQASIFCLGVEGFAELVCSYVRVQKEMQIHSKRFVDALNMAEDLSDVFNSELAFEACSSSSNL